MRMTQSIRSAPTAALRVWLVCMVSILMPVPALLGQDKVDTELLLLIDVSGSVRASEYDRILDAYGNAMTSSAVLDAIQEGRTGKIAAAVAFFSSANRQTLGLGWMEISDIGSARLFAERLKEVARPFLGTTAIASAIDFVVPLFGSETGGIENGFLSESQIVSVFGDGPDNSSPPRVFDRSVNVMAARDNALRSGVDLINGLAFNTAPDNVTEYYEKYVIGGAVGEQQAAVQTVESFDKFEQPLTANLIAEIRAGAVVSRIEAVPEPSCVLLAVPGALVLLSRRRRDSLRP